MASVSEFTDLGSVVKSIAIFKNRKLLIVANDKSINVWDLVGLTKIGQYNAPNEIKCLQLADNEDILFAGTKGTATSGALLIFDLKKSI